MAEDQTKPHWWQTLPAILTGIVALIGAITTLLITLNQTDLLASHDGTTETSTPAGPLPQTDAQGFLDSDARCDPGNPAAAMGRTKQSVLVLCQTGPGAFYYRGVRRNAGTVITLPNAVQSSGGFDVTNPNDRTRYEIRPEGLTIVMNDSGPMSEPWEEYWPR
jgi:hypothetical protein